MIRTAISLPRRARLPMPGRWPCAIRPCCLADMQQDRQRLIAWIQQQARLTPATQLDPRPSARQVAFAERIARIKRRAVPPECFRDKALMSKWIDGNK